MPLADPDRLHDALAGLLGADRVSRDEAAIAAHSGDKWFAAHPPDVVVAARLMTSGVNWPRVWKW